MPEASAVTAASQKADYTTASPNGCLESRRLTRAVDRETLAEPRHSFPGTSYKGNETECAHWISINPFLKLKHQGYCKKLKTLLITIDPPNLPT